jgi:RND family efflux transporter MFP subunit
LGKSDFASQSVVDQARAKLDSDKAKLLNDQAGVTIAAINYGYTRVTAPFDGIVTAHLVSIGGLVGVSGPTKLATIVQLDPIYVTFNVSEQDVLRVKTAMAARGLTPAQVGKIPIEVGLMNETGFPHQGTIDYIAPNLDTSTGTLEVRGIFDNPKRALLPGMFTRIRVPLAISETEALLVPDRAIGADQAGNYLLVVDKDNVVQQRTVVTGQLVGQLRVITSGITIDDVIVVSGNQRAIPGEKIEPQMTTITNDVSPPPAPAAATPAPATTAPAPASKP